MCECDHSAWLQCFCFRVNYNHLWLSKCCFVAPPFSVQPRQPFCAAVVKKQKSRVSFLCDNTAAEHEPPQCPNSPLTASPKTLSRVIRVKSSTFHWTNWDAGWGWTGSLGNGLPLFICWEESKVTQDSNCFHLSVWITFNVPGVRLGVCELLQLNHRDVDQAVWVASAEWCLKVNWWSFIWWLIYLFIMCLGSPRRAHGLWFREPIRGADRGGLSGVRPAGWTVRRGWGTCKHMPLCFNHINSYCYKF